MEIIRLIVSIIFVVGIFYEAGIFTAIFCALTAIASELICYEIKRVRIVLRDIDLKRGRHEHKN